MLKLYTDASVKGNPGLAGVGIVITGKDVYEQLSIPLHGEWNNHEAEWEALYIGLQWLIEHRKTNHLLSIYTDSKLVAEAIEKEYVKKEKFRSYLEKVTSCLNEFSFSEVDWIPEKENKGADNLARQALRKAEKEASKLKK